MSDGTREFRKHVLRSVFEQTLDERVDRYLAVNHQWVTGNHHFALASAECVVLYRDGYFTSCIIVSQSVAEGILKFVAARNSVTPHDKEARQALANRLTQAGITSQQFCDSFTRIWNSYRNDFHHMNPPVAAVLLNEVAKTNVLDLAQIEHEMFGCRLVDDGRLLPLQPKYWDTESDGSVSCFVRLG